MPTSKAISKASSAATPRESRWRGIARRAGLMALGAMVMAVVVFFLLPVWISNEQGRRYLVERLNRRLNGPRVAVGSWSIGWFRATQLEKLHVTDADGNVILDCPHISCGMNLWNMVFGDYDFGSTTADALGVVIRKNADGSTSLDALLKQEAGILRAMRGAIQINNGELVLYSAKTSEEYRLQGFQATVTIASPLAPFHVQAAGKEGGGGGASLNATFPPLGEIVDTVAGGAVAGAEGEQVDRAAFFDDLDFSATRLPAGLACDFLGLDVQWRAAIGPVLESMLVAGHGNPGDVLRPVSVLARAGALDGAPPAVIDARMLLGAGERGLEVSVPAAGGRGADYHVEAALRVSPALMHFLGRINPLLAEAAAADERPGNAGGQTDDLAHISVPSGTLPVENLAGGTGYLRVSLPALVFPAKGNLSGQFAEMTGESGASRLAGSAELLRAHLEDGHWTYDNFVVTLGKSRINFSGSVEAGGAAGGKVDLLAIVPGNSDGIAGGSFRVVVGGTVARPVLLRAQ